MALRKRLKKEKKFAGEINFYKAMAVLGVIIAIAFVYGFLTSAPVMSDKPFHIASDPAGECLTCHVSDLKNVPIMPHRPMESCTMCHTPEKEASD